MSLLVVVILFICSNLYSQEYREGSLSQLVSNIKTAMPLRDSFGFTKPTSSEQITFGEIIEFILNKQYSAADSVTQLLGYVLYKWKDTDILGKEVATLINQEQEFEQHTVVFNATILPAGIYFYKIEANNYSETRKMIYLK